MTTTNQTGKNIMTDTREYSRKPFPRSYWVVPGKICSGAYPGDRDEQAMMNKLQGLIDCGVRHVINLMEPSETDHEGRPFTDYMGMLDMLGARRGAKVSSKRFPIRDVSVPTRELMKAILDDIDESISRDRPVFVHCWGGKGRTGTVVGCFLARHGIAHGKKALAMISQLRSNDPRAHEPSPETPAQRDMVISWKEGE